MPVPATNDDFLDLVRRSGVVEESKLRAYLEKIQAAAAAIPEQPSKFAAWLVRDGLLTHFQAEQILQGKFKRFTIGKYKVLEKLGVGGMGQVFLCEHRMMKRRVAVKVLPVAQAVDAAARDRFYREARAAAALDHPNIVRAYDVDNDENLHFIVMEFVDGINLHDLVKKHGPLRVERACHYIYAAAAGLDYANARGVVHRDIKPANLLVDRCGVVKILDMGLARYFTGEDEDHLTRKYDENVLGTADYLAPEQAIDSHTVDIRADIYSLGGTFYYLLTGSPPFPQGTIAQKLLLHQQREPRPIRELRPEVPEAVIAIVETMMKKNPAERYESPAAVMAALAEWVQTPIPPPSDAELPKFSRAALGTSMVANRTAASGVHVVPPAASSTSAIIDPPRGIWEDIAAETRPNLGQTRRSEPRKSAARSTAPDSTRPGRKRALLGLLALVVAAAAWGLYAAIGRPSPNAPSVPAPAANDGPRTLYVSRSATPSPEATFPTLAAAIRKVNPGDTILLVDSPHEEAPLQIVAAAPGKFRNVTIEAGNADRFVQIRPPGDSLRDVKRGLLNLIGTDGLTLRNLGIDAGARLEYALTVEGPIDGLRLENVGLRSAGIAALGIQQASADVKQPAIFDRLRCVVASAQCDAIQFTGPVSNLAITHGRFFGRGANTLRFRGLARGIEITNNRIFNFDHGILLDTPANNCQFIIRNNTFHTLTVGLGFEGQPAAAAAIVPEIVLENNYFARTDRILKAPDDRIPGLRAANNARDSASASGIRSANALFREVLNYILPAPNSEDDASFLKLDRAKTNAGAQ